MDKSVQTFKFLLLLSTLRFARAINFQQVSINGSDVQISVNGLAVTGSDVESKCSLLLGNDWVEFKPWSNDEIEMVIDQLDGISIHTNVWLNPAFVVPDPFFNLFKTYFCKNGDALRSDLVFAVDPSSLDNGQTAYVEDNIEECLVLMKTWNDLPSKTGKHMVASQKCSKEIPFMCRGGQTPVATTAATTTTTTTIPAANQFTNSNHDVTSEESTSGTDASTETSTNGASSSNPDITSEESTFNNDTTSSKYGTSSNADVTTSQPNTAATGSGDTEISSDPSVEDSTDASYHTHSLIHYSTAEFISSPSSILLLTSTQLDETTLTVGPHQPQSTQSNENEITSNTVPVRVCACACSNQTRFLNVTVASEQQEEITSKIRETLTINKDILSSQIRKKESANDSRTSSQIAGIMGILVVAIFLGSIVVIDFGTAAKALMYKYITRGN